VARTIVVTGAASGIGEATAAVLERQGDTVIRVDLEQGDVTGDLGDQDSIAQVAQKIAEISDGCVDGLVANAGVSSPSPLSPKINYIGTVRLIEALRPLLVESGAPRISVTTSAATLQGNDEELVDLLLAGDAEAALARGAELAEQGPAAGYANYSSSKRAISRWIRRVAPTDDYAGLGIGIKRRRTRSGAHGDDEGALLHRGRTPAGRNGYARTLQRPRRCRGHRGGARLPRLRRELTDDRTDHLRRRRLRRPQPRR
jgi:NAD(P)-dependent dehydrogenase (short-subunit alcohol dehydrogenase family)